MKSKSWKTYNQRHKVVARAQQLARSGRHADHTTIIRELADMDGFEAVRDRLEEGAIRIQLDRLCAVTCRLVLAETGVGHKRSGNDDGDPRREGGDCSHSPA